MRPILAFVLALASCSEPPCVSNDRPLVLVHGFLAAGDTWANHASRFVANGACADRIYAYDWNSVGGDDTPAPLDTFIDAILAKTGATQVDLAGHSAGGGVGYRYLEDATRAKKVAHYAHVASFPQAGPAGPGGSVKTLNLYSADDLVVKEGADIPGATNVRLTGADHYETATNEASFVAIYTHFHDGTAPRTTALPTDEAPRIAGKVLTLGENQPLVGATVTVWEISPGTGAREDEVDAFTTDATGAWGPFEADPTLRYELHVAPVDPSAQPIRYYREPFVRSNSHVYLRAVPPPDTLAGGLLAGIAYDDAHAVTIVFLANRALVAGTDSLTVGGVQFATEALAARAKTTIAVFAYDENLNGQTEGTILKSLVAPFLGGLDTFLPAGKPVVVQLNARKIVMPAWPSATEGASVAVFE